MEKMNENQKDILEGISGILVIFGFLPSLITLVGNVIPFIITPDANITNIMMRYLAVIILSYMTIVTRERVYALAPLVWFVWLLLAIFVNIPILFNILGTILVVVGVYYLFKVLD